MLTLCDKSYFGSHDVNNLTLLCLDRANPRCSSLHELRHILYYKDH